MKKYRWIALLCILCLVLGGCSSRKAAKQLDESVYLHTSGTTIVDAAGNEMPVKSKQVTLSAEMTDIAALDAALAEEGYNSLTLRIMSDMLDASTDVWALKEETVDFIGQTMAKCTEASRYLFVEMGEYPEEYYAWYDDSEFNDKVITLWSSIAELLKGEKYLGAYVVNNIPRSGVSEDRTALEYYEQLLQQICDTIRSKDAQQMIVVGMMTPYFLGEDAYHAFPMIKDHNFAFAAPLEDLYFYSQQETADTDATAHLNYPNNFWHGVNMVSTFDTIHGSEITTASMDYQTRATEIFTVEEEGLFARIGANVTPADENGGGELRVLSVHFAECDDDDNETRVIYNMDSSVGVPFEYRVTGGSLGQGSVYDDGTAYLESITGDTFFYVADLNIPLEKGKRYQLTVTMKQRGMNSGFSCTPTVQMYSCEKHFTLDAALIQNNCDALFAEAEAVGVPLIYNDIGVGEAVTENKGKEQYLSDVISYIDTLGQSYIAY